MDILTILVAIITMRLLLKTETLLLHHFLILLAHVSPGSLKIMLLHHAVLARVGWAHLLPVKDKNSD
jgi:hypothetical protein